jgi:rod shape determining protein RodA
VNKKVLTHYNWRLVAVTLLLLGVGLINLYSSLSFWGGSGGVRLFWTQIAWIILGCGAMCLVSFFDYRNYEYMAFGLYFTIIVMLVLVLLVGKTVGGNKSWLGIWGIGIQPGEFAKLITIIVLSRYFAKNPKPDGYTFFELIPPGIIAIIPMVLVILGRDVGTAFFFVVLFISMAWFARMRISALIVIVVMISIVGYVGYTHVFSESQKSRFTTFVNPEEDVKGSGYHLAQSKIAVGSGGVWGRGYLKGRINKLRYLPEKHTDFVFPVLAEEWGFVGSAATLILYLLFMLFSIDIALRCRERFGVFLALGVVSLIFWQVFINICGVLGLMPLTGVTLPLLSYGGSSIISVLMGIGILLNISLKRYLF